MSELPKPLPALFSLAEDMADGLHRHEAAVQIKQNTEAALRADLAAARTAEAAFQTERKNRQTANTAVTVADSNIRAFLASYKKVLGKLYGEAWSAAWTAAGWPQNTTAVPKTQDERFELATKAAAWLTANPPKENAGLDVTAAFATGLREALSNARDAAHNAVTMKNEGLLARDTAADTVRTRMRGLVGELGQLLGDADPRWDAFGLEAPGSVHTPDAPENLVLTAAGAGKVLADWAEARRVDHYRVWLLVGGVDTDFRAVAAPTDSDATLADLPTGKTVRVQITAVNVAGESVPGAVQEIVVA